MAKTVQRMKERYHQEVVPSLVKEFQYGSRMAVPRLDRVVVNMGVGSAAGEDHRFLEEAVEELRLVTGQQPVVTRAKKSIAAFKVREGMPVGVMVTLRRERMWEFAERLIHFVLPRVRDFRGVSLKSFDHHGNYTLGLRDQLIFPEVDYNKVQRTLGMNVTFVTTARTDEEGTALLRGLGMPFQR